MKNHLGTLSDPTKFHSSISIDNLDCQLLKQMLKSMIVIRKTEQHLALGRKSGHVDWRDDVDVGVDRSLDDIENWKSRDPISRLSRAMIKEGIWSEVEEASINEQLDIDIAEAWEQAMHDPYPDSDSTLKYVYSSNSLKD